MHGASVERIKKRAEGDDAPLHSHSQSDDSGLSTDTNKALELLEHIATLVLLITMGNSVGVGERGDVEKAKCYFELETHLQGKL